MFKGFVTRDRILRFLLCPKRCLKRCNKSPKKVLKRCERQKRCEREISPKFDLTHNKIVPACNLSCHPVFILQNTFKRNEPSTKHIFLMPVPIFELWTWTVLYVDFLLNKKYFKNLKNEQSFVTQIFR